MKVKYCLIAQAVFLAISVAASLIYKENQTVVFGASFFAYSIMFIVFEMILTRKMEKAIKARYPDMLFTHGYTKVAAKVAKEDGYDEIPKRIKDTKIVFAAYIVSFVFAVVYLIETIDLNEAQSISVF